MRRHRPHPRRKAPRQPIPLDTDAFDLLFERIHRHEPVGPVVEPVEHDGHPQPAARPDERLRSGQFRFENSGGLARLGLRAFLEDHVEMRALQHQVSDARRPVDHVVGHRERLRPRQAEDAAAKDQEEESCTKNQSHPVRKA